MLLGHYELSIDERKIGKLPVSYRTQFSGSSFITQGFDQNLILLTGQAFETIMEKLRTLNIADPLARLLLRKIIGNASEVMIDETGQFQLPRLLAEYAKIDRVAILVGQGDYCEIWHPEIWSNQQELLHEIHKKPDSFVNLTINLS